MATAHPTVATDGTEIAFELDRFEQTAEDRLELTGRWFGVRGRRFVRPTLTLLADGSRCRALADLEHKPWPAHDGEAWQATFSCEVGDAEVADVELAVAPDIAVQLPAPSADAEPVRVAVRREIAPPKSASAGDEVGELSRALKEARSEIEHLRVELEEAHAARLQAASALARRDQALTKLEQLSAERDVLARQRDGLARQRDGLTRQRDDATRQLGGLARERDHALSAEAKALEQLDSTRAGAEEQLAELRSQLDHEEAQPQRPVPAVPLRPEPPRPDAKWLPRALAVVVLLCVLVAFLIVVGWL